MDESSAGNDPEGGELLLDPFPPRELSAQVLALEALLNQELDSPIYYSPDVPYRDSLLASSATGLSVTYYNIQGPIDGIISMYVATGHQGHFELALQLCENMVAAANVDRNGDGHPEWDGSVDGVPPGDGRPDVMLYDVQGAAPIARLARIIITTPYLAQTYGDRGQAMLYFVDEHIVNKWLVSYHSLSHLQGLENWSDMASLVTRILTDLYRATGDPERRDLAAGFGQQFIDTVLVYDPEYDSYSWPSVANADTSHTNREVFFVEACIQAGIVFTDTDLLRVANNLVHNMWNGSFTDPRITNYHTGYNGPVPGSSRGPWEWGLIDKGWVLSGRVSPTVQEIGQAIVDLTQTDPHINGTVEYSSANNAVISFCGNLARNLYLNGQ